MFVIILGAKVDTFIEIHKKLSCFLTKPRRKRYVYLVKPRGKRKFMMIKPRRIITVFLIKPRGMNIRLNMLNGKLSCRLLVEIDAFLLDDQRTMAHLGEDAAHILAHDAEEEQLDGGEEKQAYDHRRQP